MNQKIIYEGNKKYIVENEKKNERLYDEAYENFRKRKETNPNFGYTKHEK